MRRRAAPALAALAALLAPAAVQAHLADTGLGPVYDGIAHLLGAFDDLLPVLALALLAGLNGPAAGRSTLLALPLAWAVGGLAGTALAGLSPPSWPTALSMLLLGGLTAAHARLAPPLLAGLATLLGLVHGGLNGATIATAGRDPLGLAGIAAAVFVLTALASASVLSLRRPWTRIAVRAAGSWVAASGLLMLGWTLRAA